MEWNQVERLYSFELLKNILQSDRIDLLRLRRQMQQMNELHKLIAT